MPDLAQGGCSFWRLVAKEVYEMEEMSEVQASAYIAEAPARTAIRTQAWKQITAQRLNEQRDPARCAGCQD